MGRFVHVLRGVGAFTLLVVVVVAIPWALWHFVGWPLPHRVPSASQVGRALNHQGIPDQALVDALAAVVWVAWATLVVSLLVEVPAALSGRQARHLPAVAILQPVASYLVAAIIVGSLALIPRTAHAASAATSRGDFSLAGRRPLPALVVRDAVQTGLVQPMLTSADSSGPTAPAAPVTAHPLSPSPSGPTIYVVQRGDTLWGIAQRQLGDPLRWSEIYQLNEGRPQPGGVALTDPHWIDPGWTLALPMTSSPPAPVMSPAPTAATPQDTTPQTTPSPTVQTSPSASSGEAITTDPPAKPAPVSTPARSTAEAPHVMSDSDAAQRPGDENRDVVRLVSGSVVAGSFAAGVVSALVAERLRRRRRYRPSPPLPGVNLDPEPESAGLRDLLTSVRRDRLDDVEDLESPVRPEPAPMTVIPDDDALVHPDLIEVAARGDQIVGLALSDWPGLALAGPGAAVSLRAWLATLFTRNGPYGAEILAIGSLGNLLFPGFELPELHQVESLEAALALVEGEMAARERLLENAGVPDAATHRHLFPEYPFPLVLIVADSVPQSLEARWLEMVASATKLGAGALLLVPDDGGTVLSNAVRGVQLLVDEGGNVRGVTPPSLSEILEGSQLFGLTSDEAVDLLAPVARVHRDDGNEEDSSESDFADFGPHDFDVPALENDVTGNRLGEVEGNGQQRLRQVEPTEIQWPTAESAQSVAVPIRVGVLGPAEVEAWGERISTGLRASAYELLAWYVLHPEGATAEAAIDALWPDVSAKRGRERFWTALGNLRSRLKGLRQEGIEIITKVGGHYRPDPAVLDIDLWRFESALVEAVRAASPAAAVVALETACATYRGDFYPNGEALWVEPVREDLHRRALDAHIRLAVLHSEAGRVEAAIAVLERTIELDTICEDAYRRLITLQIGADREDAAQRTWRLLLGRLAELDLEPEESTSALMREVSMPRSSRTGRHP